MSTGLSTRLLAALLLLGHHRAQAQTKPAPPAGPALHTYQGEYEGGRATYTYYLGDDGQRVRHGRFESVRLEKGHSLILNWQIISTDYTEHRETGTYADGSATGRWTTTVAEYSRPGNRRTVLPTDYTRRQTTTTTYVNGDINGPATYANVPWKAGKAGPPTASASARRITRTERMTATIAPRSMFDPSIDDEHPRTEREKMGLATEIDTTVEVTEYAAGPYRYTGEADASDPAHRPQTARGFFDAAGFCDSTWTLRYWQSGSERADATPRRQASGWMTSVLAFDHGALLRERTTQESMGEVIGEFALPLSAARDTASRLVLLREPVHFHVWANAQNHPDEPEWHSPIADGDDITFFLHAATQPLGAPRLATVYFRLTPTAADSAVLARARDVYSAVRRQWPDSVLNQRAAASLPLVFTDHSSVALLNMELRRLLSADEMDREPDNRTAYLRHYLTFYAHAEHQASGQNLHPWLRSLTEANPQLSLEKICQWQRQYLGYLASIRLRTQQLQARLGPAAGTAPAGAAQVTPAKP